MARLVIGGQFALLVRHDHGAPLGAHRDLVLAFSKSSIVTNRLPVRAAISAASLTRFARSAPEKPGVPRAISAEVDIVSERHPPGMDREDLSRP